MSTKPIKSASRVVPSHAGRYSQNSVTRYWSLEINYHTAPNNERTALPILQKIISVPLRLLGSAEYILIYVSKPILINSKENIMRGGPMKMYVILRSVRDAEISCQIGLFQNGITRKKLKIIEQNC